MEDTLSCWDGLLEFYQGLNLTKIARGISSDPSCAIKPSIFGDFIRQFSDQQANKSVPTPAQKTPMKVSSESAGGKARPLFLLTLRLDLLVFSKQVEASISSKQEFMTAVSKTRGELRRSIKAAVEAVAVPHFIKYVIDARSQLICTLNCLKQYLSTEPEAIPKLNLGLELMTFLCLVANIWIATNLDDKELALLLAENFAPLLKNIDDKIGPSQIFEFVSNNLLFLAETPVDEPLSSEFKKSISNLNFKTENAAKLLRDLGAVGEKTEVTEQKLLILSRKNSFGTRVLFKLAHLVLDQNEAQVLRISDIYHVLVTNSLDRVCTNPLESNVFNRLYLKKLLKLLDELFSRCPQLARLYGGKALDAVAHGHLKSAQHFNLIQPKGLTLVLTLFSVPELRDSCVLLADKMLIFPTAQITIPATLHDSGDEGLPQKSEAPNSQHKLSLEDGKVICLEEIIEISTSQKASFFVDQAAQLANKILDHCIQTQNTNVLIFVHAFEFLTELKNCAANHAEINLELLNIASQILAVCQKLTSRISINPNRTSVELGQHTETPRAQNQIVAEWLSFRDKSYGADSDMGNMTFRARTSNYQDQSSEEQNKRNKESHRKREESIVENSVSFRVRDKSGSIEGSLDDLKFPSQTPRFGRGYSLLDESRSVNLHFMNNDVSLTTRPPQHEGRQLLDKRVKAGHLYTTGFGQNESKSPPSELSALQGEPAPKTEFPSATEDPEAKDLPEIDLT